MAKKLISQHIQYWTVGFDANGNLIPLPVISNVEEIELDHKTCKIHRLDNIYETSQKQNSTLLMLDKEKFGLDENGHKVFSLKWRVIHQFIRADSVDSARDAIEEIKKKY